MKVPQGGFTLEQVCMLAHQYAVYIHIGVAGADVGKLPPEITVQVSNNLPDTTPKAFSSQFSKLNPRLNEQMSRALVKYCQEVSPKSKLLIA